MGVHFLWYAEIHLARGVINHWIGNGDSNSDIVTSSQEQFKSIVMPIMSEGMTRQRLDEDYMDCVIKICKPNSSIWVTAAPTRKQVTRWRCYRAIIWPSPLLDRLLLHKTEVSAHSALPSSVIDNLLLFSGVYGGRAEWRWFIWMTGTPGRSRATRMIDLFPRRRSSLGLSLLVCGAAALCTVH